MVSYSAYDAALSQHNIPGLVKAKNFLVFQGNVEAVASQSPKELSRLTDQIPGSLGLAPDYKQAGDALERAAENATFNFNKRRGTMGDIKQYKGQKGQVERFEQHCQERVRRVLFRVLVRVSNGPGPSRCRTTLSCPPTDSVRAISHPTIPRRVRAGYLRPEQSPGWVAQGLAAEAQEGPRVGAQRAGQGARERDEEREEDQGRGEGT